MKMITQRSCSSCFTLLCALIVTARGDGNLRASLSSSGRWTSRLELLTKAVVVDPRDSAAVLDFTTHQTARKNSGTRYSKDHADGWSSSISHEDEEGGATTALLCVPSASAQTAKAALVKLCRPNTQSSGVHSSKSERAGNGDDGGGDDRRAPLRGVQAVFSSKRDDAMCFVVHGNSLRIQAAAEELQTVTLLAPLPAAAKLSGSLFLAPPASASPPSAAPPPSPFLEYNEYKHIPKKRAGRERVVSNLFHESAHIPGTTSSTDGATKPAAASATATDGLIVTLAPGAELFDLSFSGGGKRAKGVHQMEGSWTADLGHDRHRRSPDSPVAATTTVERWFEEEVLRLAKLWCGGNDNAEGDFEEGSQQATPPHLWFVDRFLPRRRTSATTATKANRKDEDSGDADEDGSKEVSEEDDEEEEAQCDFSGLSVLLPDHDLKPNESPERVSTGGGGGSSARLHILGLESLREEQSFPTPKGSSNEEEEEEVKGASADTTTKRRRVMKERCLLSLLASLAASPQVQHVGPKAPLATRNGRGARLIQSSLNAASPYSSAQPIWDLGLTGAGQVLGIADTGLDTASCFFSSSSDQGPGVVHASYVGGAANSATSFDLSQPKVVQYVEYVDGFDEEGGHGTHVSASAVGAIGGGWASAVASGASQTDVCSSPSDANGVLDCEVPNYFTDSSCSSTSALSFCALTSGSGFSDGGDNQGACANACYCTLGYFSRTQGQTCSELLQDSKGVAHGAKAAFFDIGNSATKAVTAPANLDTSMFPYAFAAGARVHQNAWGLEGVYTYSAYDVDVDTYVFNNPEFLVVFAAGNDGYYGSSSSLIESPAQSKNALVVGAAETGRWMTYPSRSMDPNNVANFSASGPTYDGRTKPDVVAPGFYVVSAKATSTSTASCRVFADQGTSMAAPSVSGAALLVREYLADSAVFTDHLRAVSADLKWPDCLPGMPPGCIPGSPLPGGLSLTLGAGGALVKAMLIHSTVAMSAWDTEYRPNAPDRTDAVAQLVSLGAPPDNYQGHGRVDLSTVLLPAFSTPLSGGLSLWCSGGLTIGSGQSASLTFHLVSTSAQPLKATLVWYDPPNSVGASKQLLNDLDLEVQDRASGQRWFGNNAVSASLSDDVNNVEKVWVAAPPTSEGDYTITVKANSLTTSTQAYALVITGGGYLVADTYSWARISVGENAPTTHPTTSPQPTVSPLPSPLPTAQPTPPPTTSLKPSPHPSTKPSPPPTLGPTTQAEKNEEDNDDDAGDRVNDWIDDNMIAAGIVLLTVVFCLTFAVNRCLCSSKKQRRGNHTLANGTNNALLGQPQPQGTGTASSPTESDPGSANGLNNASSKKSGGWCCCGVCCGCAATSCCSLCCCSGGGEKQQQQQQHALNGGGGQQDLSVGVRAHAIGRMVRLEDGRTVRLAPGVELKQMDRSLGGGDGRRRAPSDVVAVRAQDMATLDQDGAPTKPARPPRRKTIKATLPSSSEDGGGGGGGGGTELEGGQKEEAKNNVSLPAMNNDLMRGRAVSLAHRSTSKSPPRGAPRGAVRGSGVDPLLAPHTGGGHDDGSVVGAAGGGEGGSRSGRRVTVPEGALPGDLLQFELSAGGGSSTETVHVTVPHGAQPGHVIEVNVPAPSAPAPAPSAPPAEKVPPLPTRPPPPPSAPPSEESSFGVAVVVQTNGGASGGNVAAPPSVMRFQKAGNVNYTEPAAFDPANDHRARRVHDQAANGRSPRHRRAATAEDASPTRRNRNALSATQQQEEDQAQTLFSTRTDRTQSFAGNGARNSPQRGHSPTSHSPSRQALPTKQQQQQQQGGGGGDYYEDDDAAAVRMTVKAQEEQAEAERETEVNERMANEMVYAPPPKPPARPPALSTSNGQDWLEVALGEEDDDKGTHGNVGKAADESSAARRKSRVI